VAGNKSSTQLPLPPLGCGGEWKETGKKLVSRDKGSLTEQQIKGTITTMIQTRGIQKTNQPNTESCSHRLPPTCARQPQESSRHPASPQPEPSMIAHGMEYPALFGQVGSACPAVSLPGFW